MNGVRRRRVEGREGGKTAAKGGRAVATVQPPGRIGGESGWSRARVPFLSSSVFVPLSLSYHVPLSSVSLSQPAYKTRFFHEGEKSGWEWGENRRISKRRKKTLGLLADRQLSAVLRHCYTFYHAFFFILFLFFSEYATLFSFFFFLQFYLF